MRFGQSGMRALESQFTSGTEKQGLDTCDGEDHAQQKIERRAGRGTGQKTLREFCNDEGIDLSWAVEQRSRVDFTAKETMTMRKIADEFAMHPSELRGILNDRQ